jgi:hypothetical protein
MNFGPFKEHHVEFNPGGFSVITGENGSGKTQLAGAIVAAVLGKSALRIDKKGVGPSTVELVLTEGVRSESLRLTVSQLAGGEVRILQSSDDAEETDPTDGELARRLKSIWSNPSGPGLLLDANAFRDREPLTELPTIAAFLPKELKQRPEWQRLWGDGDFSRRSLSGGQQMLLTLLAEMARRNSAPEHLPLIFDEFPGYLAEEYLEILDWALQDVGRASQVLLLANKRVGLSVTGSSARFQGHGTGYLEALLAITILSVSSVPAREHVASQNGSSVRSFSRRESPV